MPRRFFVALFLIALLAAPVAGLRPASAGAAASVATLDAPARPAFGQLVPGREAVVRGDGDCLRLRDFPSLSGSQISCVADGTTLDVLEGSVSADGYDWQHVRVHGVAGWVASDFLDPLPPAPACGSQAGSSGIGPGLLGWVPESGWGLVIWGGGTAHGIANAAALKGCNLRSVWATKTEGGFVSYIFGAPAFVNVAWFQEFPGGRIPTGTPLMIKCDHTVGRLARSIEGAPAAAALPIPPPSSAAPQPVHAKPAPTISAEAAVVIDAGSGAVLFDKDARESYAPASLTKIATAILAIEGSDLGGWVENDVDSRVMYDSSLMGLLPGDCFTVADLLYGLMLPSGNDAALALGRHLSGSDEEFVDALNTLLHRLGLDDSEFANPHGLDEAGHHASAYDLAMLARYGMTLPEFASIVGETYWTARGSRDLSMRNGNYLLGSYADADGVKTGFTEDAGLTLVASATRDDRRLFVVLLNAPNRFEEARWLLDWAFEEHLWPG
ncbi:MAG: SH3 domain-containing protein [Chloroflexi bacterium]|nr:SH3 domain-containing protein [Chloroflexota bacterium]